MIKAKEYLGDAVYANFDGYSVVLTTEDGIQATNTIMLEPECLFALDQYLKRLQVWIAEARAAIAQKEADKALTGADASQDNQGDGVKG